MYRLVSICLPNMNIDVQYVCDLFSVLVAASGSAPGVRPPVIVKPRGSP